MFELISAQKNLEDVVLNPKTKETLNNLLKQVDKSVINRLKVWGIKDKKRGIDAKIIFYGVAGTGGFVGVAGVGSGFFGTSMFALSQPSLSPGIVGVFTQATFLAFMFEAVA